MAGVAVWMSCVQSSPQIRWCIFWGESAPDCPCFYPCFFVWYRKMWHSRVQGSARTNGLRIFSILITWTVGPQLPHPESMRSQGSGRKDVPTFPFTCLKDLTNGLTVVWMGVFPGYSSPGQWTWVALAATSESIAAAGQKDGSGKSYRPSITAQVMFVVFEPLGIGSRYRGSKSIPPHLDRARQQKIGQSVSAFPRPCRRVLRSPRWYGPAPPYP